MEWLATEDGSRLVWGLYLRAMGLVYVVALGVYATQARGLAGRHGLTPLRYTLARQWRDFGWRALWYFPSVYWVNCSDAALVGIPAFGAFCGLLVAVGTVYSPALLVAAWVIMLSIDGAVFPWDSMLIESGFLAIWLPPLTYSLLPLLGFGTPAPGAALASSLAVAALPSPLLSFAFRWLLFRLLFGFGKLKFIGSGWRDRFYIRSFLIGQPMVSPIGWLAHHTVPEALWPLFLLGMFVVEMVAPFFLFGTGMLRVVAAASIAGLMLGIQLSGNFGYFNLLTSVMCLPSLAHADALSLSLVDFFPHGVSMQAVLAAPPAELLVTHWRALAFALLYCAYMFPVSLLQLVMNSWINLAWPFWNGVYRLRLHPALWWTKAYARALRSLAQFRIVAGYGVFPPESSPPMRWAVCYEGSADGATWRRYEMRHYLSGPRTPPSFIAPWHPRLDHALFYESMGLGAGPSGVLVNGSPYAFHGSATMWTRLQLRLLEGGAAGAAMAPFFRTNPFPDPAAPPRFVRAVVSCFSPLPLAHAARTGEYWQEMCAGLHLPPVSLASLAAQQLASAAPKAHLPDDGSPALDSQWPLNDMGPLPEDWWCEGLEWRARRGHASAGVTPEEEEEAWGFIAALRSAAAEAATELAAEAATELAAAGGGGSAASRGSMGCAAATAAATSTAAEETAGGPRGRLRQPQARAGAKRGSSSSRGRGSGGPSTTPPPGLPSMSRPMAENLAAAFVRLPLDPEALRRAAGALSCLPPSADGAVPAVVEREVFTWSVLPGAVARVRARYPAAQLVRVRTTLNRMAAPLLRAAQCVFDREPPLRGELRAELAAVAAAGGPGGPPLFAPHYEEVGDMILSAHPRDSGLELAKLGGLPTQGEDGMPIYYFRGNDDAGVGDAMRNPLRWLMHAQRVMLVGGRRAYGAMARGFTADARAPQRLAPAAASDGNDLLPGIPLPRVWELLCARGALSPVDMATEAGSFLLFSLCFDSLTGSAIATHRGSSQGRMTRQRAALPSFMPAALGLVPRTLAHPELRRAHAPHADPAALGRWDAGGSGDETGGFIQPPSVPLWVCYGEEARWRRLEGMTQ